MSEGDAGLGLGRFDVGVELLTTARGIRSSMTTEPPAFSMASLMRDAQACSNSRRATDESGPRPFAQCVRVLLGEHLGDVTHDGLEALQDLILELVELEHAHRFVTDADSQQDVDDADDTGVHDSLDSQGSSRP